MKNIISIQRNVLHGQSKGCWLCLHIGFTMIYFHRFWNRSNPSQGIRVEINAPIKSQDRNGEGYALGRWSIGR